MKQLSEDVDIFKISKSWIQNEKIFSEKKSDRKKKHFFSDRKKIDRFFQIDFFRSKKIPIEKNQRSKKNQSIFLIGGYVIIISGIQFCKD